MTERQAEPEAQTPRAAKRAASAPSGPRDVAGVGKDLLAGGGLHEVDEIESRGGFFRLVRVEPKDPCERVTALIDGQDVRGDSADIKSLDALFVRKVDTAISDAFLVLGDRLDDGLIIREHLHGLRIRFVFHRQFAESKIGPGDRIPAEKVDRGVRTANHLPVLNGAGIDVAYL